jgi:hypothetical protein
MTAASPCFTIDTGIGVSEIIVAAAGLEISEANYAKSLSEVARRYIAVAKIGRGYR